MYQLVRDLLYQTNSSTQGPLRVGKAGLRVLHNFPWWDVALICTLCEVQQANETNHPRASLFHLQLGFVFRCVYDGTATSDLCCGFWSCVFLGEPKWESLAEVPLCRHANIRSHPAVSFSPYPKRDVCLSLRGQYNVQAPRCFLLHLMLSACSKANSDFPRTPCQ